jgi:TatA/E family protein of Tat protein translocase
VDNLISMAFLGGSSIGSAEVLLLLILILILFGPKKLPELARTIGRFLGEFRRASSDFQRSLMTADQPPRQPDEVREKDVSTPVAPSAAVLPASSSENKPEGRPDDPA